MTAAALILLGLAALIAVAAWVRPRAFDPQLKQPHDWTRGGDDAA